MSKDEIKAKADQAVEMFLEVTPFDISLNDSVESADQKLIQDRKVAIRCAILMYEDRVKLVGQIIISVDLMDQESVDSNLKLLTDNQAILTELKSRV